MAYQFLCKRKLQRKLQTKKCHSTNEKIALKLEFLNKIVKKTNIEWEAAQILRLKNKSSGFLATNESKVVVTWFCWYKQTDETKVE